MHASSAGRTSEAGGNTSNCVNAGRRLCQRPVPLRERKHANTDAFMTDCMMQWTFLMKARYYLWRLYLAAFILHGYYINDFRYIRPPVGDATQRALACRVRGNASHALNDCETFEAMQTSDRLVKGQSSPQVKRYRIVVP